MTCPREYAYKSATQSSTPYAFISLFESSLEGSHSGFSPFSASCLTSRTRSAMGHVPSSTDAIC